MVKGWVGWVDNVLVPMPRYAVITEYVCTSHGYKSYAVTARAWCGIYVKCSKYLGSAEWKIAWRLIYYHGIEYETRYPSSLREPSWGHLPRMSVLSVSLLCSTVLCICLPLLLPTSPVLASPDCPSAPWSVIRTVGGEGVGSLPSSRGC